MCALLRYTYIFVDDKSKLNSANPCETTGTSETINNDTGSTPGPIPDRCPYEFPSQMAYMANQRINASREKPQEKTNSDHSNSIDTNLCI